MGLWGQGVGVGSGRGVRPWGQAVGLGRGFGVWVSGQAVGLGCRVRPWVWVVGLGCQVVGGDVLLLLRRQLPDIEFPDIE